MLVGVQSEIRSTVGVTITDLNLFLVVECRNNGTA